jgi:nitroreductase
VNVLDAIGSLRVVRRYAERPLDPAHLEAILRAGRAARRRTTSAGFHHLPAAMASGLGEVGPYAGHVAQAAAAVALVYPNPSGEAPHSTNWDLGLASQNMILAAWSLGIGSCPITVYEPELARRILDYPPDHACEQLLAFGYPADPDDLTRPLRPGRRRPLDEVVHRERW